MNIEVIISCMNQKDDSIIDKSNLNFENTLIINQCANKNNTIKSTNNLHRIINSETKGLSVSRNLGINYSNADICVLSDDDEIFVNNLSNTIKEGYNFFKDADIIAFIVDDHRNSLGYKAKKLSYLELLKVSSVQITFNRKKILNQGIKFDEKIGSGTSNGAGEENKFLLDCYKAGLNIYFYPKIIAKLKHSESRWFNGFDKIYFYNDGKSNRYIMGLPLSIIYSMYFIITKYTLYKNDIGIIKAIYYMLLGIFNNDIAKE